MLTSIRDPSFFCRWVSMRVTDSPHNTLSRKAWNSSCLASGTMGFGRPRTSCLPHPNIRSAALFHMVTIPMGYIAMIASGDAWNSARSVSLVSRSASSLASRASVRAFDSSFAFESAMVRS